MPYVYIHLIEGRTEEQKRKMASKITDIISDVAKVEKELVHILFVDLPKTNISKGGILVSDKEHQK